MDIISFLTSFFESNRVSLFEAFMLMCFGLSWPVSIVKALRTKIVQGKSPLFNVLIATGYACGIYHKIMYSHDYIIVFYIFNLTAIITDLCLYARYRPRKARITPPNAPANSINTYKNNSALHCAGN